MAGRSASYGAWARRTEPGEVSPAPTLDVSTVTRHYRNSIAVLMGVAMSGAIAYCDEGEDDEGNELTLIVRRPVFRHGAELRLKVIEAGQDVIYHLGIEAKGFTPFAADVMIHDIGKDNFQTQVELCGDMIAAQSFLGHLLRNPD